MQYWINNSELKHLTPPGDRFPETNLFETLQSVCVGKVFEFGCGDGRLAPAFDPESYYGMDINPAAIKKARIDNPKYSFGLSPATGDTFLAYTVLMHVPDEKIWEVVSLASESYRIVVGEILGRKWRRPGNPPVFNRERQEYEEIFGRKSTMVEVPYNRYGQNLSLLVMNL